MLLPLKSAISSKHRISIVNKINILYVATNFDCSRLQVQTIKKYLELFNFLNFFNVSILFEIDSFCAIGLK